MNEILLVLSHFGYIWKCSVSLQIIWEKRIVLFYSDRYDYRQY